MTQWTPEPPAGFSAKYTDKKGKPLRVLPQNLPLSRCPHCGITNPLLASSVQMQSTGTGGERKWRCFICSVCGGVVTAATPANSDYVSHCFPAVDEIDSNIPPRPRDFLTQARDGLSQPALSIMGCASAVDAMLKVKGLTKGTLNARIDEAAVAHLITQDMAKWAHQVRLDANDQRHPDESAPPPTPEDARRCLDFALALAEVLFVLPARVTGGIQQITPAQP